MTEADDGPCAGAETPTTLRMQLQVQIGSMAAALDHDDGSQIVHSGMQNLQSKVNLYPETKEIFFSVEGVGVVAPNGSLLETGAPHKRGEGFCKEINCLIGAIATIHLIVRRLYHQSNAFYIP